VTVTDELLARNNRHKLPQRLEADRSRCRPLRGPAGTGMSAGLPPAEPLSTEPLSTKLLSTELQLLGTPRGRQL